MTRDEIIRRQITEVVLNANEIYDLMDEERRDLLHDELAPCYPTVFIAAYAALDETFTDWMIFQEGIDVSNLMADPKEMMHASIKGDEVDMRWRIIDSDLEEEEKDAALRALNLMIMLREEAINMGEDPETVTRSWKVYGADGHRQALSFGESQRYDFSTENNPRILEILKADRTGTNEYVIIRITRSTAEECERELEGQLSDGFFENHRYGEVVEI